MDLVFTTINEKKRLKENSPMKDCLHQENIKTNKPNPRTITEGHYSVRLSGLCNGPGKPVQEACSEQERVGASQGCGCENQRGAEVSAAKSTLQNVSMSTVDKCIIVTLEFRKHF